MEVYILDNTSQNVISGPAASAPSKEHVRNANVWTLSWKLWRWGSAIYILASPPDDCDTHRSLRTTVLGNVSMAVSKSCIKGNSNKRLF